MVKILHIIHGLNLGGAENFIYNLLSAIDSTKFKFDFAIQEPQINHIKFKELIEKKQGKIYHIADYLKNPLKQYWDLKRLLGSEKYDVVHIHINAFINPIPAIIASKLKRKVIIHSHSTSNGKGGIIGKSVHHINKLIFLKKKFFRLACSYEAGQWMFGDNQFTVISNAIELDKFSYSEEKRKKIRNENNIGDSILIGQVGRLISLKNQKFSINILAELNKKFPDKKYKLMFLGDGEEKDNLIRIVREKNLTEDVIFKGNVHNPNEYYSAFDIYIMPSKFEGLAVAAIEAQGSGLKSIFSSTIPKEANQTESVIFIPLENKEEWINTIHDISNPYSRSAIAKKLKGSSFDNKNMAKIIEKIYQGDTIINIQVDS